MVGQNVFVVERRRWSFSPSTTYGVAVRSTEGISEKSEATVGVVIFTSGLGKIVILPATEFCV